MAGEAIVRKDRPDAAIKIDRGRGGADGERREDEKNARFHVVGLCVEYSEKHESPGFGHTSGVAMASEYF